MTPSDVRIFHRSIYRPAMLYSLPAVAVDEELFAPVQSKILASILNGIGVSRTIPTAIRHGPSSMGGLDLIDLRTEAGIASIKLLRDSIFSGSETGKMILINLFHSQLEAGIGAPLLADPNISVPYLTPTWITSIRQFAYQHNLSITTTAVYTPRLRTTNDRYLMDSTHLASFTPSQILDINLVRIYLQASTLSDLSAGDDGRTICEHRFRGERPPSFNLQPHWPRQVPPTRSQIQLWKKFLSINFLRYRHFWKHPLGNLLQVPSSLPNTPFATSLHPYDYPSLKDFLRALPQFFRRLLYHHEQLATDHEIWRAFRSRSRLEIVTDGSLATGIGTFGWRLLRPPSLILYEGSGPIDGPAELSTSTRSELGGFAAPLLLVAALSRYWGLSHRCKFRWIVDSTAAISKVHMVTRKGAHPYRQPSNIDFLSIIAELFQEIRRPISITWVKGHQDSDAGTRQLSRDACNNIAVDALATKHRVDRRLHPCQLIPHLDAMRVSISMNGLRLTGHFDDMIRFHINGYHLRIHMQSKFQWTDEAWSIIDHHLFGRHFKSLPPAAQVQRMKFVYDQQPLGVHKLKHTPLADHTEIDRCPCCLQTTEDQIHLLRCLENPLRPAALRAFQKRLHSQDLHALFYLISFGVLHWMSGSVPIATAWDLRGYARHMHPSISIAINQQATIGWLSGIKGFLSTAWYDVAIQSMDHPTSVHPADGHRRLTLVIQALHELTQQLWKGRNESLHKSTEHRAVKLASAADAELKHYHDHPEMLAPSDRHHCDRPLSTLLRSTPSNRRRWLRQVKLARSRRQKDLSTQSQMFQFFPRHPEPLRPNTRPTPTSPTIPLPFPANTPVRQSTILDFFRRRPSNEPSHAPLPPPKPQIRQTSIRAYFSRRPSA